jgi:hypothetical protein
MIPEIEECANILDGIKDEILDTIRDLDEAALNWTPLSAEMTNSVYSLVVHICGSESQMIHHLVGGLQINRDRDAEFIAKGTSVAELEGLMKNASKTSREVLESLNAGQLTEVRDSGLWGKFTVRRAILRQIHHQALHLGQVQLTKQLYEDSIS